MVVHAVNQTGVATVYWKDTNNGEHLRVYYQDNHNFVNEVKWDNGVWTTPGKEVYPAPSQKTSLAAIVYPSSESLPLRESTNPEIRVYYVDTADPSDPVIVEIKKPKGSDDFILSNSAVPAAKLSPHSGLAAFEYSDPHVRLFYQDTDNFIQEISFNSSDNKWIQGQKISPSAAYQGTPIGAYVGQDYPSYPQLTVVWKDSHLNVAGAYANWQESWQQINFPAQYKTSQDGHIVVVSWHQHGAHIYYEDSDEYIKQLTGTGSGTSLTWSGPTTPFTGDITGQSAVEGDSLGAVAFAAPGSGRLLYQPRSQTVIDEVEIQ